MNQEREQEPKRETLNGTNGKKDRLPMTFKQIEKISDGCRRMKIWVGGCKGRNMGSQRSTHSTQFESQISHSRDRYIESSSNMRNAFSQHVLVISVKTNIQSSIQHLCNTVKITTQSSKSRGIWTQHPLHNQYMHQSQCGAVEHIDTGKLKPSVRIAYVTDEAVIGHGMEAEVDRQWRRTHRIAAELFKRLILGKRSVMGHLHSNV
ncbi:hypothetical protein DFH09DRAFT_1093419 [Mycena vulgaris]|nr:hypothetical protein DFH09DRAFT_1093419 [Mycena vulgaris]